MASIKNEMIRIAENFFTAQLHAHRNASFPHTPSVEQPPTPTTSPAQPKVSLPRRIYILLRNGRPLDTYTDPDTADYDTLKSETVFFSYDSFTIEAKERPKLDKQSWR